MSRRSEWARDWLITGAGLILGLLVCGGALAGLGQVLQWMDDAFRRPPGRPVMAPDPAVLPGVVAGLDKASTAHGVCYGWTLTEVAGWGGNRHVREVSAGSNVGAGLRVTGQSDRCPSWLELRVTMTYDGKSVEAHVTIAADGVDTPRPSTADLARLGFDDHAFAYRPAGTTVDAVRALPMLAAEVRGTAPLPVAASTDPPATLPSVGGDFWRDRGTALIAAALLLLAAGAGAALLRHIEQRARLRAAVAAARVTPRPRVRGRPRGHSGNLDAVRSARRADDR